MNNRKRKVADIALKLFVEKGIQQTSIQEIIEKANISKGTFYNYFSSKNDCISDILELLRYDASQQRIAIQIGKDTQDRDVFIEQITILLRLNEERNVQPLFEAILSSNETDLKKLVLQHRVIEMEWLSNRMIEVMGEEIRDYSMEATVLFYGMLQYLLFTLRITNTSYSLRQLVEVLLSYTELILPSMIKKGRPLLNHSAVHLLSTNVNKKLVTVGELIQIGNDLREQCPFNEDQQDLFDAIMDELQQKRIRKIVLGHLLKPFQHSFKESENTAQAETFTNMVWYYLQTI